MARYRKANELSIVTSNAIMFDSIRDIFHLLKEREQLLTSIEEKDRLIATLLERDVSDGE